MKPTFLITLKIFWSLEWRRFIALLGLAAFCFLPIMSITFYETITFTPGVKELLEDSRQLMSILVGGLVIIYILGFIIGMLYINRWVFNKLPEIYFQECRVMLMKGHEQTSKFGVLDALCVQFSAIWRIAILTCGAYGLFFLISPSLLFLYIGTIAFISPIDVLMYVFGFWWMLHTKRTGRYLLLKPREEVDLDRLKSEPNWPEN